MPCTGQRRTGATALWWLDRWGWLLALWGAAVAVYGFPPNSMWSLVCVAPAPLWALCLRASGRIAFARGWLYGVGFFGALLWWIVPTVVGYGNLPAAAGVGYLFALAAYLALYPALCGVAVAMVARKSPTWALVLAPIAWTGLEGLRGFLLTGFPWGDLPQALWRMRLALAAAPWVGIDGVRLVLAGFATAASWAMARWLGHHSLSPRGLILSVASCAVWGLLYILPSPLGRPKGEVEVAVVQGSIEQAQKWDPAFRSQTLNVYTGLSRSVSGAHPSVVVWPETAAPFYAQEPGSERRRIESLAQELRAYIVFGAPAYVRGPSAKVEYRNAVFLMDPEGRLVGRYDKVHLVPFGEYVPFGKYLSFVKKLVQGAGDFTSGPRVEILRNGADLPVLGPMICFEVIFPFIAEALVRQGAQALVVVTNDGWFGRTPGPFQHLAFAAWRAAEAGVPLIRAANTGISAVFDATGGLVCDTRLMDRTAFATRIRFREAKPMPELSVRPWITPLCLALASFFVFATL
jgi:apolipoprotein N-acyltransferase